MDIQKKKDKEYLIKRKRKLPEITKKKKSIRHLVDNFPKYANRHEIAYF